MEKKVIDEVPTETLVEEIKTIVSGELDVTDVTRVVNKILELDPDAQYDMFNHIINNEYILTTNKEKRNTILETILADRAFGEFRCRILESQGEL